MLVTAVLKELGFAVQAFASADEFLASDYLDETKCLLLDITMSSMSDPDLQRELAVREHNIPIVFITAQGDNNIRPQALRLGAVKCLPKPFGDTALRDAVDAALRAR